MTLTYRQLNGAFLLAKVIRTHPDGFVDLQLNCGIPECTRCPVVEHVKEGTDKGTYQVNEH